jgi:hypothetical protein
MFSKEPTLKRTKNALSYLVIASLPLLSVGVAEAKTPSKYAQKPRHEAAVKKPKETMKVAMAATTIAVPALAVAQASEPVAASPTPSQVTDAQHTATPAPSATNPYLVPQQWISAPGAYSASSYSASAHYAPVAPVAPQASVDQLVMKLKSSLNSIPLFNDEAILPRIKTVYPTGEKPLVVLTFKCPTEAIGITTPPIKAMRELVNLGMAGANRTNLLPFNMQQVCQ